MRHAVRGLPLNREIYRRASLRDWAMLLDLGCGAGEFLLEARRDRHHRGLLVALDRREAPLRQLEERARRTGLPVQTVQADARSLPWESECFDGVILRNRLEPAEELKTMLQEVRRVVRPAGRVVLVTRSGVNLRHCQEFRRRLSLEFPGLPLEPCPPATTQEQVTDLLVPIFGPVESHVLDDPLHFRHLEDYLRFFDTYRTRYDPVPDDGLWDQALARVASWASSWFDVRQALAEPRRYGIYVGTVL